MKMQIGDRFTNSTGDVVWEFCGNEWICVGGTETAFRIGYKVEYNIAVDPNLHTDGYWTYLGNFSKSKNFSNLYDLLQG